jgi:hypothetical protein
MRRTSKLRLPRKNDTMSCFSYSQLLELPPIPAPRFDCMAGCHAPHQQTAFAKKKRHDVVFFVQPTSCVW